MPAQSKNEILENMAVSFGFNVIQNSAHVLLTLQRNGINNEDFIKWFEKKVLDIKLHIAEAKKEGTKLRQDQKYYSRRCPDCGNPMNLFSVNSSPRNQTGDNSKSAWYCTDALNCGSEIYSEKSVEDEIKNFSTDLAKLRKRMRNASKQRG